MSWRAGPEGTFSWAVLCKQVTRVNDMDGGLVTPAQREPPRIPPAPQKARPPPLDTSQQGLAAGPGGRNSNGPLGSLLAQLGSPGGAAPAQVTACFLQHVLKIVWLFSSLDKSCDECLRQHSILLGRATRMELSQAVRLQAAGQSDRGPGDCVGRSRTCLRGWRTRTGRAGACRSAAPSPRTPPQTARAPCQSTRRLQRCPPLASAL